MSSTLAELQAAKASLPNRIVEAAMSGDADLLESVQQEQSTIRFRLYAAQVAQLQREIADAKAYLAEVKTELQVEGAKSKALIEERQALEKRIALQSRASGIADSQVVHAKSELLKLENRLEQIVSEQAGYAETLRAPVMRSLWHAPKP